ncbi:hypothetical protein HUT19_15550 [Streptomyces sp. NA02950]|uniref:metallopeptidase TldD-related protein n=1 Tax=Streptomyces sp. NA02950 TaxID=2742137 RepID=UPI001590A924|nr:metallopeptidase TldD-related protein [Streptomyces sp. NA02950]QKV92996.1 hypothetical protein HUT19_15550 [Streptomyces sp. NA02950]
MLTSAETPEDLGATVAAISAEASARTAEWHLLLLDHQQTTTELSNGQVDASRSSGETTAYLRLMVDGRIGTATSSRPDRVEELVQDAWDCARCGPTADHSFAPSSKPDTPDRTSGLLPDDAVLAGTRDLTHQVAELQQHSKLLLHGTITRTDEAVYIAGPVGVVHDRLGRWGVSAVAESPIVENLQLTWHTWTRRPQLPEEVAEWTGTAGAWQDLPALPCPPGLREVLLAPNAVHALLSPLMRSLGGPASNGRSFLPAELGDRLLDKRLTVTDGSCTGGQRNRTADGLPHPAVDDEGVACRPLVLIDAGGPIHRYHTSHSAAAVGATPTGHGFRGNALRRKPLQPISAVLNNVRVHADATLTTSWHELLASIENGIVVESLFGAEQKGRLSPVVEGGVQQGFVVQHGRVVARLRRTSFRMDLREALGADLAGVSTQSWPVSKVWTGKMPFLLARSLQD